MAVRAKPEYAPLLPYLPDLEAAQFTMAQLTNEALPTPSEAALFAAVYDDNTICRARFLNALSASRPDLVPIFTAAFTDQTATDVRLVQRKITWGEASRAGQSRLNELRQRLADANRQWIADLNASHQAELAQRQAAGAALMQWSAQQQMINAMNRPVQTTCSGVGDFVNCTSR